MTIAAIVISATFSGANAQGELVQEVTKEQFDTWMSELSNWGRWGADDQLGALNTITPEKRVQATGLVQSGTVVSMARPMVIVPLESSDNLDANRPPVLLGSVRNVFDIDTSNGYFWERYEIEYHGSVVSHLDALCHVAYDGKLYNGVDFEEVVTKVDGCTQMGVANVTGRLVTRGILIDMPGKAIRRQDVENWEAETGVTISAGDALFLRTGRDVGEQGGYHPSLLPFFRERDIAVLGADMAQEGGEVEGVSIPVHVFTLVALGVHLFDNLGLEELVETARDLGRWEFLFMASPPEMPNGAGAAVTPLAMF